MTKMNKFEIVIYLNLKRPENDERNHNSRELTGLRNSTHICESNEVSNSTFIFLTEKKTKAIALLFFRFLAIFEEKIKVELDTS